MPNFKGNDGNLMQHWVLCELLMVARKYTTHLVFVDAHAMAPIATCRSEKQANRRRKFDWVLKNLPGQGSSYEQAWQVLSPDREGYPNSANFVRHLWRPPGVCSMVLCECDEPTVSLLRSWRVEHDDMEIEIESGDWRTRFDRAFPKRDGLVFISFDPYMFNRRHRRKENPGNMYPADLERLLDEDGTMHSLKVRSRDFCRYCLGGGSDSSTSDVALDDRRTSGRRDPAPVGPGARPRPDLRARLRPDPVPIHGHRDHRGGRCSSRSTPAARSPCRSSPQAAASSPRRFARSSGRAAMRRSDDGAAHVTAPVSGTTPRGAPAVRSRTAGDRSLHGARRPVLTPAWQGASPRHGLALSDAPPQFGNVSRNGARVYGVSGLRVRRGGLVRAACAVLHKCGSRRLSGGSACRGNEQCHRPGPRRRRRLHRLRADIGRQGMAGRERRGLCSGGWVGSSRGSTSRGDGFAVPGRRVRTGRREGSWGRGSPDQECAAGSPEQARIDLSTDGSEA